MSAPFRSHRSTPFPHPPTQVFAVFKIIRVRWLWLQCAVSSSRLCCCLCPRRTALWAMRAKWCSCACCAKSGAKDGAGGRRSMPCFGGGTTSLLGAKVSGGGEAGSDSGSDGPESTWGSAGSDGEAHRSPYCNGLCAWVSERDVDYAMSPLSQIDGYGPGIFLGSTLFLFLITLALSSIAPLISSVGLLYFVVMCVARGVPVCPPSYCCACIVRC